MWPVWEGSGPVEVRESAPITTPPPSPVYFTAMMVVCEVSYSMIKQQFHSQA